MGSGTSPCPSVAPGKLLPTGREKLSVVRNEASCWVCGSPVSPENGNAALQWTENSWIYRKKTALSRVSLPQAPQTAFRGEAALRVGLWTVQRRPFGWICCWGNLWRKKMQPETHQMTCTERRCLFFHVIFFYLVEGKFVPRHGSSGSHLFST